MSQYGADAMAEEGKGYVEILQHYYTGVTVEECRRSISPNRAKPGARPRGFPAAGLFCGKRVALWVESGVR